MMPIVLLAVAASVAWGQPKTYPLDSLDGLKAHKVKAEPVVYKGRKAIRVTEASVGDNEDKLVLLTGSAFRDGVIEVEISGEPGTGASAAARGFAGIAFRVSAALDQFEAMYLRPTNGRAEDQVRRNHSVQYISYPEFPWHRLRKEFPEKYESYVDLVPGEFAKVKIEVKGSSARLYVHGATQPTLIVSDLRHPAAAGQVALWIGPGTVAHFSGLRISP